MKIDIYNTDKKYNIIYSDPPWAYKRNVGQGVAIDQYKTMDNKDICNLPISELCEKNCALICWVTFPKIEQGIEVIKSWGFEIKTVFATWIKTNKKNGKPFFGIGSYTKSNAEVCLLATKGKMHQFVKSNSISSIVMQPIRKHSQKPEEVRKMITDLFGDLPRIELFARQNAEGWDCWGLEAPEDK